MHWDGQKAATRQVWGGNNKGLGATPVQGLQNLGGCQVELVQQQPMALAQGCYQSALLEDQLALLIGHVTAQVLL